MICCGCIAPSHATSRCMFTWAQAAQQVHDNTVHHTGAESRVFLYQMQQGGVAICRTYSVYARRALCPSLDDDAGSACLFGATVLYTTHSITNGDSPCDSSWCVCCTRYVHLDWRFAGINQHCTVLYYTALPQRSDLEQCAMPDRTDPWSVRLSPPTSQVLICGAIVQQSIPRWSEMKVAHRVQKIVEMLNR
jgi:hypothetical protein